jgi:cytochrome c oxidase subunit 2
MYIIYGDYQHKCSVNDATLNRFFALHFVLPFLLAALALMHLIALHDRAGSGNPLGISGNPDRLPFAPYYIFKDLITIFIFILVLSIFVFYMPNILGDSENYVMANPMQTPSAIVPEWYLLPFYAILRSIPNKLLGVIAMFSAILMLLVMAFVDMTSLRGIQFKPLSKIMFFLFVGNFLALTQLGAEHVESPFIEYGQISTIFYFAYFLIVIPYVSLFENGLTELWLKKDLSKKTQDVTVYENKNEEVEFIVPLQAAMQSNIFGGYNIIFSSKNKNNYSNINLRGFSTSSLLYTDNNADKSNESSNYNDKDNTNNSEDVPNNNDHDNTNESDDVSMTGDNLDNRENSPTEDILLENRQDLETNMIAQQRAENLFEEYDRHATALDRQSVRVADRIQETAERNITEIIGRCKQSLVEKYETENREDPKKEAYNKVEDYRLDTFENAGDRMSNDPVQLTDNGAQNCTRMYDKLIEDCPDIHGYDPNYTGASEASGAPEVEEASEALDALQLEEALEALERAEASEALERVEALEALERVQASEASEAEASEAEASKASEAEASKASEAEESEGLETVEGDNKRKRDYGSDNESEELEMVNGDDKRKRSYDSDNELPESECDAPRPWGVYFQDSGTPQMEALVELHDNIVFYLIIILFGVGWLLVTIMNKFGDMASPLSQRFTSHGTTIEIIWTVTPGIILILIAFPSFKLLYLMDEIIDPIFAIFAEGHQWYWSYQYVDFLNDDYESLEFDSYLIPETDLEDGALRMLEVDNRLVVPELTHIRFVVQGADVIHSFACPALGLKCDAYPGRLNQSSFMISRAGTFYGQCSEICGILHSSMPTVIEAVSSEKFVKWLLQQ